MSLPHANPAHGHLAPPPDSDETRVTRARYDRVAPIYDALDWMMELRARRWRRELWSRVGPGRILELGVGTGKNIPFHPKDRRVVALDISEAMLARARHRAVRLEANVDLEVGDVQQLPYPDDSFDVVVATFLFCSVPNPILGLTEARRVLKPGGQLLLLEHVLSKKPVLRPIMRWMDAIPLHIWGAHVDRDTVSNVRLTGFERIADTNLSLDIVSRIEATAPDGPRMLEGSRHA